MLAITQKSKKSSPWNGPKKNSPAVCKLVNEHQGLVYHELRKITGLFPSVDMDSILEHGETALWRCAISFKPEMGFKFSTYAMRSIGREMKNRVNKELSRKRQIKTIAFNPSIHNQVNKVESVLDSLIHKEDREKIIAFIRRTMSRMELRERKIIEGRLLQDKTLQEIGNDLGISKERVRQIESEVIETLRLKIKKYRGLY